MAKRIVHENWHKIDTYSRPPLYIARVHLGVTNAEPQPIFNEEDSICIFMEGEVFGYEEEKKKLESSGHKFKVGNDPEYCLHLFEEHGERFVEKLDGSFIIIIYDIKQKKIIIACDRYGLRPFYFARNGKKYLFASEVKAILQDKDFRKEINDEAVADFFAFGRIFGDKTFLKRITTFSPGSILVWRMEELSVNKYWDFEFNEHYRHRQSERYYAYNLAKIFKKAVEKRMRGSHRFGLFLSGGLDSRAIAGVVRRRVSTFTYGVAGGDEARIAEKVGKQIGTEQRFIRLREDYLCSFAEKGVYLTDGMLNCLHFHWISLLPEIRKRVDVMFHGSAQDILLGTYLSRLGTSFYLVDRHMSKAERKILAGLLYKKVNDVVKDEMMPQFFSKNYYQKIKKMPFRSLKESLRNVKSEKPINRIDSFFLKQYGRYHLSYQILRNYIEDRIPGLDNDFVDFILKIPPELRYRTRIYHKFLTELSPDLARIPYQKTGLPPTFPLIAHRIGFVIKQGYKVFAGKIRNLTRGRIALPANIGYPDLGEWIQRNKKLRQSFEDILLDEKTLNRPYFNAEFIIRMVNDHMSGKKNYAKQLCTLLTFELWYRFFMD